jgi:hypothetical protein
MAMLGSFDRVEDLVTPAERERHAVVASAMAAAFA